jgi:PD-(D/E)XK nuclease superfamily protein
VSFVPRSLEEVTHEWPPELDHLSAGSFKMLVRCPEQWRQRYVLGKKVPPALAMLVGGADHAAIEHSMRPKVESGTDLPVQEVQTRFVHELEARVDNSGGLGEIEIRGAADKPARVKAYDEARRDGPHLVGIYHEKVSPTLQPLVVEKQFSIEVPGVPVPVIGYIDMIAAPAQETLMESEGPAIIERKRAGSAKSKAEPDWTMQGEVYQLSDPLPYHFHISVATKNPRVLTPSLGAPALAVPLAPRKRSELLVRQLAAEVGFYYMRYGPEHPWPAKGKLHPWACAYCGYKPDCWGWKT